MAARSLRPFCFTKLQPGPAGAFLEPVELEAEQALLDPLRRDPGIGRAGVHAGVAPLEERDEQRLRLRVRRKAGEDALGGVGRVVPEREHGGPQLAGRLAGQVGRRQPRGGFLMRLGDREEKAKEVALHRVDRAEHGFRVECIR